MASFSKSILTYLILISLIIFSIDDLKAQNQDTIYSDEPLHFSSDFFDQEKPLDISLTFNIKKLISNKDLDEYLPAIVSVFMDDSVQIKKPVKIKPRGNVRKSICYFPPYVLNFKKSDISEDLPSDLDKIKVVTHCVRSKEYSNYIFKEYIAYKICNIITDYSFKVRLAKITYIDTGRKNKTYTEWSFLIEPENVMAERLDALPIKLDKMSHTHLDTLNGTIMALFQYMIGNTDFALSNRHNLKLIKIKDYTKPAIIPIPYDFDYSGLVNAHYAVPKEGLAVKNITERYYYGICRTDEVYNEVIKLFLDKEKLVFDYIQSCDFLDNKTRKYVVDYLEEFYKKIQEPKFINNCIRNTCF